MKNTQIKASLKVSFLAFVCMVAFGFTTTKTVNSSNKEVVTTVMESQFHEYVAKIIFDEGLNQEEIAAMMAIAELKKGDCDSASNYVEYYMNEQFKGLSMAALTGDNRASVAAPVVSTVSDIVACGYSAYAIVSQDVVGYYYAYAESCDGSYEYDSGYYSGGSWVYARAEAHNCCRDAFIIF